MSSQSLKNLFTQPDAWNGGFFEFTFELPQESKSLANVVLAKLWSAPTLNGCYLKRDIEPEQQEKFSPTEFQNEGHWYGVANLPNGKQSCCGTVWTEYENDGYWITFYLPLGSLANSYNIDSYPFKAEKQGVSSWMIEVNNWLVNIARLIHPVAKFELGIIGFEVDYFEVKKQLEKGLPNERWDGVLIAKDKVLEWLPPTIYNSPHVIHR